MDKTTELIELLKSHASPDHSGKNETFRNPGRTGAGRPGTATAKIAKPYKRQHELALSLWETGWHEARLLAPMIADPARTTPELADRWTDGFDAWDICDMCCQNLLRHTPFALTKFTLMLPRRGVRPPTAFALIATLAVGEKSGDEKFIPLFDLIETASADPRNFVRKAVNWALRQTGKRNLRLHTQAVALSRRLGASADRTAAWIGRDALRELSDPKIIARIKP